MRRIFGLIVFALFLSSALADDGPFRFEDVTTARGIDFQNVCGAPAGKKGWLSESMGAGAAWFDYDQDGRLDLYLVNGSDHNRKPGTGEPNRLFRQTENGKFQDVTESTGLGDRGWGHGVAIGDFDNDGFDDVFIANFGTDALYRNQGDGTFKNVTANSGIDGKGWSSSAAWFDLEGDGDLDLYVAHYVDFDRDRIPRGGSEEAKKRSTCMVQGVPVFCGPLGLIPEQDVLYRNLGQGRFEVATAAAGLELKKPRYALGVVAADFDDDGDTDLYVANDSMVNSLWRNDGKGKFRDAGMMTLSALSGAGRMQAGMGVEAGDANGDGLLDLVVTNFSHDLNTLYISSGKFYQDASVARGLGVTRMELSWGVGLRDFDNDSDLDLFIANGHLYPNMDRYDNGLDYRQRNHLFENRDGRFHERSAVSGKGMAVKRSWRAAAFADYDKDGDLDILVTSLGESPMLLENRSINTGHWLQVDGATVGARVYLTVGKRVLRRDRVGGGSYLSASEPTLHFGLGKTAKYDSLEVRWPDGSKEFFSGGAADRRIQIVKGKGSKTRGE
jgi:hypothetical protein